MAVNDEQWATAARETNQTIDELRELICSLDAHGTHLPDLPAVGLSDRQGDPLSLGQWTVLYASTSYRVLGDTGLANGIWVATLWNGTAVPEGRFETSAFGAHPLTRLWRDCKVYDTQGYDTEAQAIAGHDQMVARFREYPG